MNIRLSYILYPIAWFLLICFIIILSTQKLLIAQYILSKNGYDIFYQKATEYLFSIDIKKAKVYKNQQPVANISYMSAGFYPPFVLDATLTCGNGYTNIKDNILTKEARINSKNFPFECLKLKKAGVLDSSLKISPKGAYGFLAFKNLYIKGYNIKSLKLHFKKNIFSLKGTINIFNTLYNTKGSGVLYIDKKDIADSKISGNLIVNTPIKTLKLVVSGSVINPYVNIIQ